MSEKARRTAHAQEPQNPRSDPSYETLVALPEWADVAAQALADAYGHGKRDGGLYVHEIASDGYPSFRSATPDEAARVVVQALVAAPVRVTETEEAAK